MPENLNELFSLLKQNLAYSIYSLGILEKYNANHFKLNYVIDDYPNFGIIISEFTDNNFPKLIISCKIDNSKEKYTDKFFKLIKNEEVNSELYLKKSGKSVMFEEIF